MISENIKNARKAKGISQEEMAAELNVVRQTVSKWEKGLSVPDADMLIRISDLLCVSVNDLLGIKLQNSTVEGLAKELAQLNEQLAVRKQEENLRLRANKKRGLILQLSLIAMVIALSVKDELISIILIGGCFVAVLIILYQNLGLLTKITTTDMKISTLKITTIFNLVILIFIILILWLDRAAIIEMSETDGRMFAMAIISVVILFGGFISPKLPFNRHTGLRLPWTVQDEDTWNVAHKIIGYISLPVVLLYLAMSFTVHNFGAVTGIIMLLWIGIPGLLSCIFWKKKYRKST